MRPIRLLSVLLCATAFCCGTAAGTEPDRIRIACYNVESLFDTVPDPSAGDAEFTPHSPRRWNTERYRMKINHISRVIDDLDADLLALAEVENEAVVRDLMYAMRSDYNYIHRNSGDPRGIGHLRRFDHFAVDHHVHVARRLLLHGAHHVGVAVADVAHRDARHQIVIAFPVGGVEERPLGPRDLDEHRRRRGLSHVGEKLFA